eukprot:365241-Chlamydomonas_euryale.AAC.18
MRGGRRGGAARGRGSGRWRQATDGKSTTLVPCGCCAHMALCGLVQHGKPLLTRQCRVTPHTKRHVAWRPLRTSCWCMADCRRVCGFPLCDVQDAQRTAACCRRALRHIIPRAHDFKLQLDCSILTCGPAMWMVNRPDTATSRARVRVTGSGRTKDSTSVTFNAAYPWPCCDSHMVKCKAVGVGAHAVGV